MGLPRPSQRIRVARGPGQDRAAGTRSYMAAPLPVCVQVGHGHPQVLDDWCHELTKSTRDKVDVDAPLVSWAEVGEQPGFQTGSASGLHTAVIATHLAMSVWISSRALGTRRSSTCRVRF